MQRRNKLLIFTGGYLPGFKGGGPIQSIVGIVDLLGDDVDIFVITLDRDLGDSSPYPSVKKKEWHRLGKALIYYAERKELSFFRLCELIRAVKPDAIYLNSCFSFEFTVKPLILFRIGLIPSIPRLLAPRGEFSASALSFKRLKKHIYLTLSRTCGLYNGFIWHATADMEALDIRRVLKKPAIVRVAPVIAIQPMINGGITSKLRKESGVLKLISVARINRIKNILSSLRFLRGLQGSVHFTIVGPKEDPTYFEECLDEAESLPANISVQFTGPVSNDKIPGFLRENHAFISATLNENYGHAIAEALAAGCIVIVSDRTPWRGLAAKGIGWDLNLHDTSRFSAVLQECVDMNYDEWESRSARARDYAADPVWAQMRARINRDLFGELLNGVEAIAK